MRIQSQMDWRMHAAMVDGSRIFWSSVSFVDYFEAPQKKIPVPP